MTPQPIPGEVTRPTASVESPAMAAFVDVVGKRYLTPASLSWSMYHIVYISKATLPVSETALGQMLTRWRANNERANVTGILLYSEHEQRFMQLIEGDPAELVPLFAMIEQDHRHRDLLKLADGLIPARAFTSWLMGFSVARVASFRQLAGYIDPHSAAFQQALQRSQDPLIHELLTTFFSESSDLH